METIIWIIVGIIWYVSGVYSFIYWYTKEDDLTVLLIPVVLFAGLTGILAYVFGWLIYTDKIDKILIRKKKL